VQFRNGAANIDGVNFGAEATVASGRSLEFEATFNSAPNQHVGLASSLSEGPWAIFSTFGGGGLYARTADGVNMLDTRVSVDALNRPHRFRIDWHEQTIVFSIDGTVVARHPATIGREMRVQSSDLKADGAVLTVAWIRVSPYVPRGSFTSRVFDAGETTRWNAPAWSGEEPAGTRVDLTVRTGDTPVPDATWTTFTEMPASGATTVSRYLQYRLELQTTVPGTSPMVRDVTVTGTRATVASR
jgi:hypothetical protein